MTIDKAKFRKPVIPGDRVELHMTKLNQRRNIWWYQGRARVDGVLVAEAEISAMMVPDPTSNCHSSYRCRRGRRDAWRRGRDRPLLPCRPPCELGDGVKLNSHVVRRRHTTIGARTRIFPFASHRPRAAGSKISRRGDDAAVGSDCLIREGVTMNPGTAGGRLETVVGDRCAFLAKSHVGHDCQLGEECVFSNNAMLAGHVTIGDFVICGGGSAIVKFARIGSHAFVSGLTGIGDDLIPFGLAFGNRGRLRPQPGWAEAAQFFARGHP